MVSITQSTFPQATSSVSIAQSTRSSVVDCAIDIPLQGFLWRYAIDRQPKVDCGMGVNLRLTLWLNSPFPWTT